MEKDNIVSNCLFILVCFEDRRDKFSGPNLCLNTINDILLRRNRHSAIWKIEGKAANKTCMESEFILCDKLEIG